MKTFNRICVKDAALEAQNGDRQEIKRGKEYLTTDILEDGTVIVFDRFWAPSDASLFCAAERFT